MQINVQCIENISDTKINLHKIKYFTAIVYWADPLKEIISSSPKLLNTTIGWE